MTIDERIKQLYNKYWITVSYDLTLWTKDHRTSRYKISWPTLIKKEDGTYDLDLKNQDVTLNVRGSDIPYYIALKRRTYPEYMKILEETVKRKTEEWETKRNGEVGNR